MDCMKEAFIIILASIGAFALAWIIGMVIGQTFTRMTHKPKDAKKVNQPQSNSQLRIEDD